MNKLQAAIAALALTLITSPLLAQSPPSPSPSYSSGLPGAAKPMPYAPPASQAQQTPPPTTAAAPATAKADAPAKRKHRATRAAPASRDVAARPAGSARKGSQANDNVANELNRQQLERGSAGNSMAPVPLR